jgi:hypothetical protein
MAETFTSTIYVRNGWTWTANTGNPIDDDNITYEKAFADGSDDNQAEIKWSSEARTLLDGASETFDLTALARSFFGGTLTLTFYKVKAIMIVITSTTAGKLTIGDAASAEWAGPLHTDGHTLILDPDSVYLQTNRQYGWGVDDSNKNLKVAAGGGDVIYSIVLTGTETDDGSASGSVY